MRVGREGTRRRRSRHVSVLLAATLVAALPAVAGQGATASAATGGEGKERAATSLASRFEAPPAQDRPANRYWVASGVGELDDVRSDINAMADNGIGKATFDDLVLAQFYDPSKSFTTSAWSDKLRAALETGIKRGLTLDVLISPGWSAGAAGLTPDSPGASKILGHGRSAVLKPGTAFSGQLPLSPLAKGVKKRSLQGVLAVRCADDCSGTPTKLVRSSVVDLTDRVTGSSADASGEGLTLDWTAPSTPEDASYLVLAFYSQGNALAPTAGIDSAVRGVLQVDHFSQAGAKALIDPWEDKVLDDDLRTLLRKNAGAMWLDSIELHDTNWTDAFMDSYWDSHGQSFAPSLPTVSTSGDAPFTYDGATDRQMRSNWSREMSDLFLKNHITPLRTWAHSLGTDLRYQSNISIGPSEAAIAPEAWAMTDIPDAEAADSRAIAGVSAIAGKRVNSTECCAFLDFGNDSWRQRWTDMLFRINQSFSTGANEVEYHGYAQQHAGDALNFGIIPGATNAWPGWSPFVPVTAIGDSWDTRQPSWTDQKSINEYVGRNQVVLREGELRSDFAVYSRFSSGDGHDNSLTDPAVADSGYSWGYLSDAFVREVEVDDHVLYPDGPRYKALVLDRTTDLPLDVATKILRLAQDGLPVVILGDAPSLAIETTSAQDTKSLAAAMKKLVKLPSVVQVPGSGASVQAKLPAALKSLGIEPLTAPVRPTTLTTVTRDLGDATAAFIFNSSTSETVTSDVRLTATGTPYELNSWTGVSTPIATYQAKAGSVTVPVRLAPGETTIVVVAKDPSRLGLPKSGIHAVSSTADLVMKDGVPFVRSTTAGTFETTLASGRTVRTSLPQGGDVIAPRTWTLDVESWEKPATGTDSAKRKLDRVDLETVGGKLPTWREITEPVDLSNISGTGTYTTSFDLDSRAAGAYLDLGPNFQTYSLTVNGRSVAGASQIDPRGIDLGDYLKAGPNKLTVKVSTTLRNALVTQSPATAGGSSTERQAYGLTGPVELRPYTEAELVDVPDSPPVVDTVRPVISSFAVTPRSVRRGKSVAAKFTLSESARIRVTVKRRVEGRRVDGKCVVGGKSGRKAKKCVAYRTVSTRQVMAGAGRNAVTVIPASATSRWRRGIYRVDVLAQDAAGNISRVRDARIRIRR